MTERHILNNKDHVCKNCKEADVENKEEVLWTSSCQDKLGRNEDYKDTYITW